MKTTRVIAKRAVLHRMVMADHICPYGLKAKYLLERQGFEVEDHWLTTRTATDAFKAKHDVKTTPQTFIDGKRIGGYDDLRRHFGKPMRDPGQNNAAHAVNESALAQIANRPWVHYVDSWSLFSDARGNYIGATTDVSGRPIALRQGDGLHLSREGTTWLASAAYAQIRRDWQLP